MTTIYTGECPKCGTEHRREWHGEPWKGFDGETHYAADCRKCGPGHELQMLPQADLRSRIGEEAVLVATEDDGEWTVHVYHDGLDVEHSILASRDEAIEVALAGLRIDWVRREIERGTATAADVRVALEGAPSLGWEGEDTSDLEDALMLLASEDELDAWRTEKVRRIADEMDEAEAAYRANPQVLVDRRAAS